MTNTNLESVVAMKARARAAKIDALLNCTASNRLKEDFRLNSNKVIAQQFFLRYHSDL